MQLSAEAVGDTRRGKAGSEMEVTSGGGQECAGPTMTVNVPLRIVSLLTVVSFEWDTTQNVCVVAVQRETDPGCSPTRQETIVERSGADSEVDN